MLDGLLIGRHGQFSNLSENALIDIKLHTKPRPKSLERHEKFTMHDRRRTSHTLWRHNPTWASGPGELKTITVWNLFLELFSYWIFTLLSIMFQLFHNSVWMWQGTHFPFYSATFSSSNTEVSCPPHTWHSTLSHYPDIEPTQSQLYFLCQLKHTRLEYEII